MRSTSLPGSQGAPHIRGFRMCGRLAQLSFFSRSGRLRRLLTPARLAKSGCPRACPELVEGSGSFPDLGGYAARIAVVLGVLIAAVILLSTIHPWGDLRVAIAPDPILEGSAAPANVRQVLEAKCADCHSENTHWPAYSRVAPASWLIERDVHDGRSHLNFSQWQHYSAEDQATLLNRIAAEVRSGQMPVKRYLVLHPQARLSPGEQQLLYDWAKAERKQIRKQLAAK